MCAFVSNVICHCIVFVFGCWVCQPASLYINPSQWSPMMMILIILATIIITNNILATIIIITIIILATIIITNVASVSQCDAR